MNALLYALTKAPYSVECVFNIGLSCMLSSRCLLAKEEALDDLPSKDARGSSSVTRTLEPFQLQRWRNF